MTNESPAIDPLARVLEDIQARCPQAVRMWWDDGQRTANPELRKLTVLARDLPVVFPVEQDVLAAKGAAYQHFIERVVADIERALKDAPPAPPTS